MSAWEAIRGQTAKKLDFLKVPRGCRWPRFELSLSYLAHHARFSLASCIFFSLLAQLSKLDLYSAVSKSTNNIYQLYEKLFGDSETNINSKYAFIESLKAAKTSMKIHKK